MYKDHYRFSSGKQNESYDSKTEFIIMGTANELNHYVQYGDIKFGQVQT